MKAKYGLFCVSKYDPAGGFEDMLLAFNNVAEVEAYIGVNSGNVKTSIAEDYWELVDFSTLERHPIDAKNLIVSIQEKIKD
ncbi:hypothetical protein [Paenibacillus sp. FSL R10-2771]|uniref:hypothetical protein n=1 Tax=Paenibacillus sp. FSL R10-2771 TaxID=2954693 RepID=UPI0030FA6CE1